MQTRQADIVKVGWSSDPADRGKALGYDVQFVSPEFLFPEFVERRAHANLNSVRAVDVGREYFCATVDCAKKAVTSAYPYHATLDLADYPAGSTWVTHDFDPIGKDPFQVAELVGYLIERGVSVDIRSLGVVVASAPEARAFIAGLSIGRRGRSLRTIQNSESTRRKMATGWRPGPPRLLNPDQEKQVVAWRDKGLTARQIVEEVRNAWDIKVSQRTVKNTYDRMKRK